uniref:Haloacid dehalogenase-like hydrolase domain-containing protein n=1 Tax=Vitis vinifera TaxID=29760 RepID=F6H8V4_VITVI
MATSTSVSSVSSIAIPRKARLRGVVFDMDGTLTVPVIDFPAMYRSVLGEDEYLSVKAKNPTGIDILHQIENWSPEKQRKAYETIADFERQGLDRLQIMPEMKKNILIEKKKRYRRKKSYKRKRRNQGKDERSFLHKLNKGENSQQ